MVRRIKITVNLKLLDSKLNEIVISKECLQKR